MECKTLKDVEDFLKKKGIACQKQEKTDEIPFDQLYVPLGADYSKRPLTVQLRIIENPTDEGEKGEMHYLLHSFFAFPFKVTKKSLNDTARLTNLLNKVLIMPGLMFSEADEVVAFHHVNSGTTKGISSDVIEFIIMNIVYLVDVFMPTIEDVTQGKKTFDQVVDEAKKQASESNNA